MFSQGQKIKHTDLDVYGTIKLLCTEEKQAWIDWGDSVYEWISFNNIESADTAEERFKYLTETITEDDMLFEKATEDYEEKKEKEQEKREKGQGKDSLIGKTVNGVTLTKSGLRSEEDGWWYFPRLLKVADGIEHGVYWYRKKRVDIGEDEGKIVEEYISTDDDRDMPFKIPGEFLPYIEKMVQKLHAKAKH